MFTQAQILDIIHLGESMTTEFKSDRSKLSDNDLISAIVCLANSDGGYLLVGVEDNGDITGLHKSHQNTQALASFVASRTTPSLSVQVDKVTIDSIDIAVISVPKFQGIVATTDGLIQRRRLKADGSPECVPFQPHEFIQRQSSLKLIDPSALPMMDVAVSQLDPIQRLRLRRAINTYGGDRALASLDDEQLDLALSLVIEQDGKLYPTLAGLLILGTEDLLKRHLPSHEVAFQVLSGTDVKVNEFFKKPLLETFEEVELLFRSRVEEQEVQIGLFRTPIPNYSRSGFREAFVNALVHRDYSRLGMVQIKLDDSGLTINSTGGFIEGVNLDNLLVAPPRSRNPLLADIMKRIGLAERTGRGIDRIFEGMLRYGRPAPDYSQSTSISVELYLSNAKADVEFLKMIIEQEEKQGYEMPIDSLIILSRLREERRLMTADFVTSVQKSETNVRGVLEKLTEAGLIEAHGTGRGRSYTLSLSVYQKAGETIKYVRQTGFSELQKPQMVINAIKANGYVKRADVVELCFVTEKQATTLLKQMVDNGQLVRQGNSRNTHYVLPNGTNRIE
ncbi:MULTISPECIES: RNA-binding domain-containing protein [unclassified Moraxella]|uniref:RNA-binding domain-containing protein n=1 Tax=unclassified Moraxella TaxID=2685852 RepID=UPI003AF472CD